MAAHRLRVVPANSHHGVLGTGAFLGVMSGIAFAVGWKTLMPGSMAGLVLLLVSPLVFGLVFVLALPFRTQRWLPVLSAAVCFWLSLYVSLCGAMFVCAVLSGSEPLESFPVLGTAILFFVNVLVVTVFGAGLAAACLASIRCALFRTVEQSGLLCWRCGYDTASDRIARCPECGTPVDCTRFRWGWLHRVIAIGRVAGWVGCAVVAVCALGVVAIAWESRVTPVNRFAHTMRQSGNIEPGRVFGVGGSCFASGTATVQVRATLNAARAIDLLIVYVPVSKGGPAIQLQLDSTPRAVGGGLVSNPCTPRVLCNLDATQSEVVMASGVPQSLKDAMLAAAGTVSWNGWIGTAAPPPNIGIDATPYFEPGAK